MAYDNNKRLEYRELFKEGVSNGVYRFGSACRVCSCDVRYLKSKRCVSCKHRFDANLYLKRKSVNRVFERHEID